MGSAIPLVQLGAICAPPTPAFQPAQWELLKLVISALMCVDFAPTHLIYNSFSHFYPFLQITAQQQLSRFHLKYVILPLADL